MKRFILLAAVALFALMSAAVLFSVLDRPTESDFRLAKGRAQLDTENYLAALQTLRDFPNTQRRGPEAHAYLGAAYLRLHLYQAAIKEFEEAVKQRPRGSEPWIGLAASYIKLGDAQKAVDEAKRATEIEQRSVDAWITLGRAQWQMRNFDEAEKAALKARELDPNNPAISELLLHVYFDQNQVEKFQAELDRNNRPSGEVQSLATRFFLRQGQFARAYDLKMRYERNALDRSILETELALKRDPANLELYPLLIKNLVKVGRFADAIEAGRVYKGSVPVDMELGKAYWMAGRKDEAIQAYQRASAGLLRKLSAQAALAAITRDLKHWREAYRSERIEQDYFVLAQLEDGLAQAEPMFRAFTYRYAAVFEPSFYNKAAEEALKVLDKEPGNFDALMTIGTAYHRLGRIEDAMRYMQAARDLYPKSAEPVSRMANLSLQIQQKDPQNILNLMEAAIKLEPSNASYLYNLGWAYDQIGEPTRAAEFYQRAIQASPLSFEAMNNLALIYGNTGQSDRVYPLLEQAMRTDPENEAVYANLASYYVRRRDWKQALQNYDRAQQINPGSPVAPVEKGRIHLELGQMEQAIDNLSHALEINPHSFEAYMLLSSAYEKMGHIKEATAAVEEAQRIRADAPEAKAALERLTARSDSAK
jgi:tetratricopeptide (TPR) repeat protein